MFGDLPMKNQLREKGIDIRWYFSSYHMDEHPVIAWKIK